MWSVLNINYLFCVIFAATVLLLTVLIFMRYRHIKRAKRLVKERDDRQKLVDINRALEPFGFAYSILKDIFYSLEDAWQRDFGYGKIYDEMAPVMNMIIDCEPVYFEYDNKRWMIEFWKGQYGITTGAEIGIYVKETVKEDEEDIFYDCVSKEEQLPINMTVYKNGKAMFWRRKNHWWMTGFVLGEFSYPAELMVEAVLTFPKQDMMEAFLDGCYQAGYQEEDLHVNYHSVMLRFYHPRTPQKFHHGKLYRRFIQWQNHHNCKLYHRVTKDYVRTVDKLDYLMLAYPRVFKMITHMGRCVKIMKKKKARQSDISICDDKMGKKK